MTKKCIYCARYDLLCHRYASMVNSMFPETKKVLRIGYTTGCTMENDEGKCPAYKRKWWRFWDKNEEEI